MIEMFATEALWVSNSDIFQKYKMGGKRWLTHFSPPKNYTKSASNSLPSRRVDSLVAKPSLTVIFLAERTGDPRNPGWC
jgi:hypothetical protein